MKRPAPIPGEKGYNPQDHTIHAGHTGGGAAMRKRQASRGGPVGLPPGRCGPVLPRTPEHLSREVGASDNFIGLRLIGKETPQPTTVLVHSVTYEWNGHLIEIEVVD